MIVVGAMIGAVSEWEELGERNRSTPANEWGMMLEDTRENGREFPATPGSRLRPPKRGADARRGDSDDPPIGPGSPAQVTPRGLTWRVLKGQGTRCVQRVDRTRTCGLRRQERGSGE